MIIELTLKCEEGCSHCFVNATPTGRHMTISTLKDSIRFMLKADPRVVQISGGEFTLHPQFSLFASGIIENMPYAIFVLESNGWWFQNEQYRQKILSLLRYENVHILQIRTDKRYYPNYEKIWANRQCIESIHPKIKVYEGEIELIPLGRAKNLIQENPNKSPMCANIILLNQQIHFSSLWQMIHKLESIGKFSTPSIDPDGQIHIGESVLCAPIGNVTDTPDRILNNIRSQGFCKKCNLNLNPAHLKQVSNQGG